MAEAAPSRGEAPRTAVLAQGPAEGAATPGDGRQARSPSQKKAVRLSGVTARGGACPSGHQGSGGGVDGEDGSRPPAPLTKRPGPGLSWGLTGRTPPLGQGQPTALPKFFSAPDDSRAASQGEGEGGSSSKQRCQSGSQAGQGALAGRGMLMQREERLLGSRRLSGTTCSCPSRFPPGGCGGPSGEILFFGGGGLITTASGRSEPRAAVPFVLPTVQRLDGAVTVGAEEALSGSGVPRLQRELPSQHTPPAPAGRFSARKASPGKAPPPPLTSARCRRAAPPPPGRGCAPGPSAPAASAPPGRPPGC